MSETISIEPARLEDVEAIVDLHRLVWLATYPSEEEGITTDDIKHEFQGESARAKLAIWQERVSSDDDNAQVFVARQGDQVVGTVAPKVTDTGQYRLSGLYVLPKLQDQGIGKQLLERAIEWLGDDHDIYLLVAKYIKAREFYKRFGFKETDQITGGQLQLSDGRLIPEVEMVKPATRYPLVMD